ncbi:hypothetical protein SPONN_1534 [uncultured Candidatus Thioglobus sp.]|nr:hypothetical protein SPONN_1534 [uncultured Candidatus Thioglobus sp.]
MLIIPIYAKVSNYYLAVYLYIQHANDDRYLLLFVILYF